MFGLRFPGFVLGLICLTLISGLGAVAFAGECAIVRERGGPQYAPHIVIHFGSDALVPNEIHCSTKIDTREQAFCIPLFVYNLWDGSKIVELALHTPRDPIGFERGPGVSRIEMQFGSDENGSITSLRLEADDAICGASRLGCLRLATDTLPEEFIVDVLPHGRTGRLAVRTAQDTWRPLLRHEHGALVGKSSQCEYQSCSLNTPIDDFRIEPTASPGLLDFSWKPGSGEWTVIRYRRDGRYPADPWDGELLALLPSSATRLSEIIEAPGEVHFAAWSIHRDSNGEIEAASNVECGSLGRYTVHVPVAVEASQWSKMKSLYR